MKPAIIAYCVTPHKGGTYRFYLNLRKALLSLGWDLRAVATGKEERHGWYERKLADEGCVVLAPEAAKLDDAVAAFVGWVLENDVRIVFPMCSVVAWSAMPFLPPSCRIVTRVSSTSSWALRVATPRLEQLSAVVAMTPAHRDVVCRIRPELQSIVHVIPQGVDADAFTPEEGRRGVNEQLRALYIGRLSYFDKGVDLLPAVCLRVLEKCHNFTLSIVGSGLDANHLGRQIAKLGIERHVEFASSCLPNEVAEIMRKHDILFLPSRFEGFPNTLIEGMACGLVPIASHLPGITDFVIRNGSTGFICPRDDVNAWRDTILKLEENRNILHRIALAARADICDRFSIQQTAGRFDLLFRSIIVNNSKSIVTDQGQRLPRHVVRHPLFPRRRFAELRRWLRRMIAGYVRR